MFTVIMTTYCPPETYERAQYAVRAYHSLHANLKPALYCVHVADDGSENTKFIEAIKGYAHVDKHCFSHSRVQRKGIGGSLNAALTEIGTDLWMYTTDDWVLSAQLNIANAINLIADFDYDIVRLGPVHPNLACTIKFNEKCGWWLDIDARAGGYAFATRPFLMTRAAYRRIGPFIEGKDAYDTERDYAERVVASELKIASIALHQFPWVHIGEYEVGHIQPNG